MEQHVVGTALGGAKFGFGHGSVKNISGRMQGGIDRRAKGCGAGEVNDVVSTGTRDDAQSKQGHGDFGVSFILICFI